MGTDNSVGNHVLTWLEGYLGGETRDYIARPSLFFEGRKFPMMRVNGCPRPGVTTFATCTLSKYGELGSARCELILGTRSRDDFSRVLCAAEDRALWSKRSPEWGEVFANIVTEVGLHETAERFPHVLYVPQQSWDSDLEKLVLADRTIYVTQVVPISNAERDLVAREGWESLLSRMYELGVDLFDPDRHEAAAPH